ncbi:type IV secretion system protein [Ideonella sp. DXS29W]|uniref:Type IV secretion system protein n=1 Tax=Ideonella lacteola TaxID=2984193 RepID=A0ABU9C0A1_9BURK
MNTTTPVAAGEALAHPEIPKTRPKDAFLAAFFPRFEPIDKDLDEAKRYAAETISQIEASRKTAWRIAGVLAALCLLSFGSSFYLARRPVLPPVVITVDKLTGDTQVQGAFDANSVPQISTLDKHWAQVFIRSCESYSFNMLKRDYEQCARMSSEKVFAPIGTMYQGDQARQKRVGESEEDTVDVISVRPSPGTEAGRRGEITITFDKRTKFADGRPSLLTRYISTCEFEYHPEAMKKPIDQVENPLGFMCVGYRRDAELVTPAAAVKTGGAS